MSSIISVIAGVLVVLLLAFTISYNLKKFAKGETSCGGCRGCRGGCSCKGAKPPRENK